MVRTTGLTLGTVAVALLSAGCSTPELRVTADPPGARILVDRVQVGRGAATLAVPYYGSVDIAAVRPLAKRPSTPPPRATRRLVRVAPPVAAWLFPLDFFGDVWAWAVGQPMDVVTHVEVAPRPQAKPGATPLDAPAFAARAQAARRER
ncbi:MAG: hypothetical protein AAF628_28435 [Planctomycetota bacterium]